MNPSLLLLRRCLSCTLRHQMRAISSTSYVCCDRSPSGTPTRPPLLPLSSSHPAAACAPTPRRPRTHATHSSGSQTHSLSQPRLVLHDARSGITVHESGGCVSTTSSEVRELPRTISRRLRQAGNVVEARSVLDAACISRSTRTPDLVELLLVLLESGRAPGASGPREVVQEMLDVVRDSPANWNRTVCNILLSACVREAARTGDNAAVVKREFLLRTGGDIWRAMCQNERSGDRGRGPDHLSVTLLYRICGECRALDEAREVHADAVSMNRGWGKRASEDTAAAYILCLGKCGRSVEAEELYISGVCSQFRSSPVVLDALFQAHVASDRISKAEALIAQHGAKFLNVQSCNAFVKRCSTLCLREKAIDFVSRMRTGAQFPRPNRFTYNLLIKTLCVRQAGAEDIQVSADRALLVVDEMLKEGITPNRVTYNTLMLNLADQERLLEAMELYEKMAEPDYLTFSHLMMGAAKTGDISLARRLKGDMDALDNVYPNYSFCKKLLTTVALAEGVDAAFEEAKKIAVQYVDELKMFGDVGGREAVRMALIHACGVVGDLPSAFGALRLELTGDDGEVGLLAPLYIATTLMQVCLDCCAQGQALEVFHSIKRAGLAPNFEVYEKLIHGLVSTRRGRDRPFSKLETVEDLEAEEVQGSAVTDMGGIEYLDNEVGYARPSVSRPGSDTGDSGAADIDGALDDPPFGEGDETAYEDEDIAREKQRRVPNALGIALALLCEMHAVGAARSVRPACYVYNTLIAAAARTGDLDLASQLFLKMCRHNNPGVVYLTSTTGKDEVPYRRGVLQRGSELADLGLFDVGIVFPAAVPATYASMIQAARVCGRPDLSFSVYEAMQADRINEPTQATYSLLTDVALDFSAAVGLEAVQGLLRTLDQLNFISPDLRVKRSGLRKLLVALRWRDRVM